jgi:pyruvate,water dikinase
MFRWIALGVFVASLSISGWRRAQARLEQILQDFQERDRRADSLQDRLALLETLAAEAFSTIGPHILPTIAAGLVSLSVVNRLASQVGDSSLALELTRGLEHNVTSEMDLALWATAQQIRAHGAAAQVVTEKEADALAADFLAGRLPPPAQSAVDTFIDAYGMRGTGEIDLGRPRWRNDPTPIMHTLKSYLKIDDPALAPDAVFGKGAARAEAATEEMARSLRSTRFGGLKERLLRAAARRVRALVGLRESPKFLVVRLLGLVRRGLLQSGRELVAAGTLSQPEDVFFLHLRELRALARGQQKDWAGVVARRRRRHAREQKRRQIPRLMLSNGHAFYEGVADRAAGDDAVLSGSPVSPGVVEGPVRVVFDPQGVQLAHGEILVCPGTDPAWTPLFLAAGGLVMEVGGLMTHGSVVAREYGIPAVVGVHEATVRLRSGQRVRVDGTAGSVEILDEQETLRK